MTRSLSQKLCSPLLLSIFCLAPCGARADELTDGVNGGYVEVRAVDVDLGRLLDHASIPAVGEVAIIVWKVEEGRWNGQDLTGLNVAAAVCSSRRLLNEAITRGLPVRSVLFVDKEASRDQVRALRSMVQKLTDDKIGRVVEVRRVAMSLEEAESEEDHAKKDGHDHVTGEVTFEIPEVVRIRVAVEAGDDAACSAVCGGNAQNPAEGLHNSLSQSKDRLHARTAEYSLLGDAEADDDSGSKAALLGSFSL